MGSGSWTHSTYAASSTRSAFVYASTPSARSSAHPSLDPKGLTLRESRDSIEHPLSVPIAVWLDTTGSNIEQARIVHAAMPTLMGLLLRKGYATDPQIMFSALGDATYDRVPLEVGQFESDNRMDENLGNFALEGGGGGQSTESYELALYVMARHTVADAWTKRGHKGYLFIVGDEMAYPFVHRQHVERLIGTELQEDIRLEAILEEVKRAWEIYFILPTRASHGHDAQIPAFWKPLLGQNFLEIEDATQIVPRIAAEIGASEGIGIDTIVSDLGNAGVDSKTLSLVKSSLSHRPHKSGLAKVTGGHLPATTPSGTIRLK